MTDLLYLSDATLVLEDFREKFLRCRPRRGARGSCWDAASPNRGPPRSGPLQALEDRASHHPVLVALRKEAQLLREMGDALAVGGFGKRVRQVGPPVAALRAGGVEQAAQMHGHIAKRIGFERKGGGRRHLDADVRVLGERDRLIDS